MDGIERINEMAKGQKDFVLLEIVKYLTSRIENKEKSLKGMASYIRRELIKDFCQKMNTNSPISFAQDDIYNGQKVKCLQIGMSEKQIYELAINYFNKTNEELGIIEEKIKENKEDNKNEKNDEFGSIFDTTSYNKPKNNECEIEQISLFGM